MFEQLQREINELEKQIHDLERQEQVRREHDIAIKVRSLVADYGFASPVAAQDFGRLMTSKIISSGVPSDTSMDGFLRQELALRPPLIGSYRPQEGSVESGAPVVNNLPRQVEVGTRSIDTDAIKPGMTQELFEAASREVGRLLQEESRIVYGR